MVVRDMAWLAGKCLMMIGKDVDGRPVLDYFGPGAEALGAHRDLKDSWLKAMRFAELQLMKHLDSGNKALALRYNSLKMYLVDRGDRLGFHGGS